MRQYDISNHKSTIMHKEESGSDGLCYFSVLIEGLSKVQPPPSPNDIILFRDPENLGSIDIGVIKAVHGDIVYMPFRYFDETHIFLGKPLNISFVSRGTLFANYDQAIDKVRDSASIKGRIFQHTISGANTTSNLLRATIENSDADLRLAKLNDHHRQAVNAILSAECYPKPYILVGPAGTGKTHILVEAVIQIYARYEYVRTLFCTKTEVGVDLIMAKLTKCDLIVPNTVCKLCPGDNIEDLGSTPIVVTTNVESFSLLEETRFDYVIIDDAASASELETLLPICLLKDKGCLVLAGDTMQLGPVAQIQQLADYDLTSSLFERVLQFDVYQRNKQTRQYDSRYITNLLRCYRCDPQIIAISNSLFYNNQLKVSSKSASSIVAKMNFTGPLQFFSVRGEESNPFNSTTWTNDKEAEYCVDLLMKLSQNDLQPSQVGVITPSKSQAKLIGMKLDNRVKDLFETCDRRQSTPTNRRESHEPKRMKTFQCEERDIIIISTVRSWSPCCLVDFKVEAGRFNVSMTRARKLLIVVGNEDALKSCKYWRKFLELATCNPTPTFK
jgi:hypothetical protein